MITRAVVLAGGHATRLRPLTTSINKHMLPVYDRPMIQHVVESLVSWGVTDILVLGNNIHFQPVMMLLEDGRKFGCAITYSYEVETISPGKHLALARPFARDEPFLLICGDSFFRTALPLNRLSVPHLWAMPLNDLDDFRKYAEVELVDGFVRRIVEKPLVQSTGLIQTGAWAFGPDVFERSERLMRTVQGEVQIRTIVQEYVQDGLMRGSIIPPGSFLDLGTFEALFQASALARAESKTATTIAA